MLGRIAAKGDPEAVETVSALLVSSDFYVRRYAVDTLAQIAEKGDATVMRRMIECWRVPFRPLYRDELRLAMINFFTEHVGIGNPALTSTLTSQLEDPHDEVKKFA